MFSISDYNKFQVISVSSSTWTRRLMSFAPATTHMPKIWSILRHKVISIIIEESSKIFRRRSVWSSLNSIRSGCLDDLALFEVPLRLPHYTTTFSFQDGRCRLNPNKSSPDIQSESQATYHNSWILTTEVSKPLARQLSESKFDFFSRLTRAARKQRAT